MTANRPPTKAARTRPPELVENRRMRTRAIDEALKRALDMIRADLKLSATRESAAQLAGCCLGTVNGRPSVLKALDTIKAARRTAKPQARAASDAPLAAQEIKRLQQQLSDSRDERLRLVNERDSLKRVVEKLQRQNTLLSDKVLALATQVRTGNQTPSAVVHLPPRGAGA